MPKIIVEKGPDKGKVIPVTEKGVITIGREVSSVWRLNDPLASRAHIKIEKRDSDFFILDLDSLNGTFLNGKKVKEAKLKRGDKIQVGENILTFVRDEDELKLDPLVNQIIAGYKITERVGRGGMGTVYKATQLSLNRVVAFKVLSDELTKDKDFINLFIQEARAAAQLNHPNIIQVYDVAKSGDVYFFSMEFLPNGSVHDLLLKHKKLPLAEAVRVTIQTARGLEYAEKKKIVHRDIKPDNLMLSEDFTVKIGDLGLAKQMQEKQAREEKGIFGTPHYIAPEQALGKFTDHRADIYALGSTLYRMLVGFPPYSGNSIKEIIMKKLESEPKPLREIDSNIPPSIIAVIERMMKKKPEERYQSATDVIKDLIEIEQGWTQTQPSTVVIQEKKATNVFAVVVILILLIALGLGVYFFLIKKEQGQTQNGRITPPITNGTSHKDVPRELLEQAFRSYKEAEDMYEKLIDKKNPNKIKEVIEVYTSVLHILEEYPNDSYYVNSREKIDELTQSLKIAEGEIELGMITNNIKDTLRELFSNPAKRKKIDISEKIAPLIVNLEDFANTAERPQDLVEKAKYRISLLEETKKFYMDFEKEFTKAVQDSSNFYRQEKFYDSIEVWKDFKGYCFRSSLNAKNYETDVVNYFSIKAEEEEKAIKQNVNIWFTEKIDAISDLVNKNEFDEAIKRYDELVKFAEKISEVKSTILKKKNDALTAKENYNKKIATELVNKDMQLVGLTYVKLLPNIYDFKYDDALKKYSEIESKIQTKEGKERYKKNLFSITSEKVLFDKFCELANSGKLKNDRIELPSVEPGKKPISGRITRIDSEKIYIALDVSVEMGKNLGDIPTDSIYKSMSKGWNHTTEEEICLAMFCLRRGMIKESIKHYEKAQKDDSNQNPKLKNLIDILQRLFDDEEKVQKFRDFEASLIYKFIGEDTDNKHFSLEEKLDLLEFLEEEFQNVAFYKKNRMKISSEIARIKSELEKR